jgi:hypothetical protein
VRGAFVRTRLPASTCQFVLDVVLQNYLSDSRAWKLRLEYLHEQLAAAFEPTDE